MHSSLDSSTRLSSPMGSSEHSSTLLPLLEGSAGEFAATRTSEQMKETMYQMMELKRRCCSAEEKCASFEEKCASMEHKCAFMSEEVMIVCAQNEILVQKLMECNNCISAARTKNLEGFFEKARLENPRFSECAED